jgi:membrane-bound ClpP family serine protease
MTLIVILFVAGVLLIAAEVILPGGIIGLAGGGALVGGIVVAYGEYGASGAFIAAAVAVVLVVAALIVELFLRDSIDSSSSYSKGDDSMIGSEGETITPLGPTGFVRIDGRKLEAASRSGFIDKHERIKVTGRDNFRIIVSKL